MIQQLLRATFSNIEEQGIEFVVYSLMPWLKLWEQELNAKLLKENEQESMYFEFNVNGLLRGNAQARATLYQSGITTGWLSPNEVREYENLNPYEEGDDFYMQGAMMPVDMLGQQQTAGAATATEEPPDNTDTTDAEDAADAMAQRERMLVCAARTMFVGAVDRMIRKESHEARNAAKNPKKFCDWIETAYGDEFKGLFAAAIEPTCSAMRAMGFEADKIGIVTNHCQESFAELNNLTTTATPANLAAAVEETVTGWATRAEKLAATIFTPKGKA